MMICAKCDGRNDTNYICNDCLISHPWIKLKEPKVGDHVITRCKKYEPMIGIDIPAGVTGVVTNIEPFPSMDGTLIEIYLDLPHSDLDDFDNVLQFVTGDDDVGEKVTDYIQLT